MTCQCEIYEICPDCAPSPAAFEKAVRDHDEVLRQVQSSSPSYTLREIEALAREWIEIPNGPVDYSPALTLSTFIVWLAKREREGSE